MAEQSWTELCVCVCTKQTRTERAVVYRDVLLCSTLTHRTHLVDSTSNSYQQSTEQKRDAWAGRGRRFNIESWECAVIVHRCCALFEFCRFSLYIVCRGSEFNHSNYALLLPQYIISCFVFPANTFILPKLFGCDPPVNSSSASVWALLFSFCICLSTFSSVNVFFKTYSFFRVQSD